MCPNSSGHSIVRKKCNNKQTKRTMSLLEIERQKKRQNSCELYHWRTLSELHNQRERERERERERGVHPK